MNFKRILLHIRPLYGKGFSLFEVILVIGIFSVIGLVSSDLLTRTYRTSSESDMQGTLKQNGQVAANVMSEAIRNAETVVCYGPIIGNPKDRIVLRDVAGKYSMFRFVIPTISANGFLAKQENLVPSNQGDPSQLCSAPSPLLDIPITDKDPVSGVSIINGTFTRLSSTVGSDSITMKDTVTIEFDVSPAINQKPGLGTAVKIQTTVQVR